MRIETLASAQLRWSIDGWETCLEDTTRDTGFGVHVIDLSHEKLPVGAILKFTFYWPEADKWEGKDFEIKIS